MNYLLKTCGWVGLAGVILAGSSTLGADERPAPSGKAAKKTSIAANPYLGAIVVDAATGRVLFDDKADAKGYPASTLKLMDLLIILEKIEQKQIT